MNTNGHGFWWFLWMSTILWYATMTVYIAIRGWTDIKNMLRRLKNQDLFVDPSDPSSEITERNP